MLMVQESLFAEDNESDERIRQIEMTIYKKHPAFAKLSETKRRFLIEYCTSENEGIEKIAERCGIKKSQAYALKNDDAVKDMMFPVVQAIGKLSDFKASLALDKLAEDLHNDIMDGKVNHKYLTPIQHKILADGKKRLGMDVEFAQLKVNNADGSSTEINSVSGGSDVLDKIMQAREMSNFTEVVDNE